MKKEKCKHELFALIIALKSHQEGGMPRGVIGCEKHGNHVPYNMIRNPTFDLKGVIRKYKKELIKAGIKFKK